MVLVERAAKVFVVVAIMMVVVPWYGGGRCDSNVDQDEMVVMEFDLVVVNACGANVSKYDNVDYLRENPAFQLPMTIRVHFHDCE